LQNKQSKNVDKPTRKVSKGKSIALWLAVLALTVPVFRSGLKTNLTLFEFIWNHTIFGDYPEYIPRENYEEFF
jgi:hypothetical protein